MRASDYFAAVEMRQVRESPTLSYHYGLHVTQDVTPLADGRHYHKPDGKCMDCGKPVEGRRFRCDPCKLAHKRKTDRAAQACYRKSKGVGV